jgi:hypothetical protein
LDASLLGNSHHWKRKTGILDYPRVRGDGEDKRYRLTNDGARVRDRLCERSVLIWEGRDYGNHEGE